MEQKKKVRILSIDGGGIRGVIPAVVMEYVEKKLVSLTGNAEARIADYFDLLVGTSTGGILSCFYLTPGKGNDEAKLRPRFRADDATTFYTEYGYSIFNVSKRATWLGLRQIFDATAYDPSNFEKILLENFGDLKYSDLLRRCVVTTYEMHQQRAFFFNSREKAEKKREFLLREVVRSTAAAPTYFPPARMKNLATGEEMLNVDGGVFANNPTMCAYAEARKTEFDQCAFPTAADMLILSLGTGGGQIQFPSFHNINSWGAIKWAKSAPDIMMDGSLDTVEFQMQQIFEALHDDHKANYKRIDVPANQRNYASDMADASPSNISKLKDGGKAALEAAMKGGKFEHALDDFIQLLVNNS
jgi:uncharacterized protein